MRLLVDESTGPRVAKWLHSCGHDVFSVYDESQGISDLEICLFAYENGWLIITNDKDFGELVFKNRLPHHGVVLLRLSDETVANKIYVLRQLLNAYGEQIEGRFTVVSESGIRMV